MRICAFIQMYNEIEKGNLVRCLENCRQWADDIVIYDDASTDDSVEVARHYTEHILRGETNMVSEELFHKQRLLEYALTLSPVWLMWIDCDEILDRRATAGGLRQLAADSPDDIDAYSFHELNLWRSQTYARTDSLFDTSWFCRLWRVRPGMRFQTAVGVHMQLFPITVRRIERASFEVIHYGFWDYKKMLVKIGGPDGCGDRETIQRIAPTNWILNETTCKCYRVPDEVFPPENVPADLWNEPKPRDIGHLLPYSEIDDYAVPAPFVGVKSSDEWAAFHGKQYHGDYDSILRRNRDSYTSHAYPLRPLLFDFDPVGKTVVDIGCGGGWYSAAVLNAGAKKVYGVDVDRDLLSLAERSFVELGIPPASYEFRFLGDGLEDIEEVDIIFCMTVFMHLPVPEVVAWLTWIARTLALDGEAHLQFYQTEGKTLFHRLGSSHDQWLSDFAVDVMVTEAGLTVKEKQYPRLSWLEPVWTFYVCKKRQ